MTTSLQFRTWHEVLAAAQAQKRTVYIDSDVRGYWLSPELIRGRIPATRFGTVDAAGCFWHAAGARPAYSWEKVQ